MRNVCGCEIKEIAIIALPSFGAGVLLTMFLPPALMLGTCAAASVAFGVICIISG